MGIPGVVAFFEVVFFEVALWLQPAFPFARFSSQAEITFGAFALQEKVEDGGVAQLVCIGTRKLQRVCCRANCCQARRTGERERPRGDIANLLIHSAVRIGELGGARAEVLLDAVFRLAHLRGGGGAEAGQVGMIHQAALAAPLDFQSQLNPTACKR